MINRRQLVMTAALGGLAALSGCVSDRKAEKQLRSADIQLSAVLDAIFNAEMKHLPEMMTTLGLDKDDERWCKHYLNDRSAAAVNHRFTRYREWIENIETVDRTALSPRATIEYDSFIYMAKLMVKEAALFDHGDRENPAPYTLYQMAGAYQTVPNLLKNQHVIESRDDAEAYLSRLDAFATALDQETERARHEFGMGVIPPDFILDRTLQQLEHIRSSWMEEPEFLHSLVDPISTLGIEGDWKGRARRIITGPTLAALDRQIAALRAARKYAGSIAGIWHLPDGEAYYAYGLKANTTTELSAEDIHRIGLEQVHDLSAHIDNALKVQGMSRGSVGERLEALAKDSRYLYPDTDLGRARLLTDLNGQIAMINGGLTPWFTTLPRMDVEVRRIPEAMERGAPRGYYEPGSMDGRRPGYYYINLRNTAERPSWTLPTLTHHEALPGHHLQFALALEANGISMLRKVTGFAGYGEGWALYAQQLADEMGMYESDPMGRIGYLQSLLFRAVRLVTDSGLHYKRWTRAQAIRYMTETLGERTSTVTTEVERYCVWPGQACAYKVGHTSLNEIRNRAKLKLGSNFDMPAFHNAVLCHGAMPLEVLGAHIDEWMDTVPSGKQGPRQGDQSETS